MSLVHDGLLFVVINQQSSFLHLLTADAVARPGHGFESFFGHGLATANTFAVTAIVHAHESLIDQVKHLPIVIRHRDQQLFGVGVGRHVGGILSGLGISFAAVAFGLLHLANQAFAPVH